MTLANELITFKYPVFHFDPVLEETVQELVTVYRMDRIEVDEIVSSHTVQNIDGFARPAMYRNWMIRLKDEEIYNDGKWITADTGDYYTFKDGDPISEIHWLQRGHVVASNHFCPICSVMIEE